MVSSFHLDSATDSARVGEAARVARRDIQVHPEKGAPRRGLAFLANCITPYRVYLHKEISRHIPEVKLHTLVTHDAADFSWSVQVPEEINVQYFGRAGETPIASIWNAPMREWAKGAALVQYLKSNDIAAVITPLPRYVSYLRVLRYCRRAKIPTFVRSDANIRNDRGKRLWKKVSKGWFHRWWLRDVFGVMPMGEYGRQYFEQYGAPRERMYCVPYMPDFDQFATCDSSALKDFLQKHDLDPLRKRLLFSGRLVQVKRVDLLLDAFMHLLPDYADWDLMVVGDGVLARELRSRVPTSAASRVRWTGFLDRDELVSAYHACEALVVPSDVEPWALVVQEAMAAGLAVVASDAVGAAAELVEDKVSGRIFPTGNARLLETSIRDVIDPGHLAGYQEAARTALSNWRQEINPVTEIRRALVDAGVLAN